MNFWRFAPVDSQMDLLLTGHHDHWTTPAATALAILAAWVLLPVTDRFNSSKNPTRYFWVVAGAFAMGTGIWAMHFTSMLSFHLPVTVEYDVTITLLSIIPATLASASTIMTYHRARVSLIWLHCAALLMAAGIGTMHYLGMEAMILPADMYYSPGLFLLSIAAAYLLALSGLYANIRLGHNKAHKVLARFVSSVILGIAVTSMHMIAMRSTYFMVSEQLPQHAMTMSNTSLISGIVVITFLLLGLTIIGMIVDKRLEMMARSLQRSEIRFKSLAETTQTAIFTFEEGRITYANPALRSITGYDENQLLSLPIEQILGKDFHDYAMGIIGASTPFGQAYYEQFEVTTADNRKVWLYFSLTLAEIDNRAAILGSACDISFQKDAELKLQVMAYNDPLTKLGNRAKFIDRLENHLELMRRRKVAASSCVMLLDLDKFKKINDTYGHLQGDHLLRGVADRLRPLARNCDTTARLGGDEFVIIFQELRSENDAVIIANRILDALLPPFLLGNRDVPVRSSIGIVMLDSEKHKTPDDVLHEADIALYRAKSQGRACWQIFDEEMDYNAKRTHVLRRELVEALQEKSLVLNYQPIYRVGSHDFSGFEALCRWQRKNGDWVRPDEFIKIAEENGLVAEIDLWALEQACFQLSQWNELCDSRDHYISVNMTSWTFHDERLLEQVRDAFLRYKLAPGQLKLELTERVLAIDTDELIRVLQALSEYGCEIMIDDFGTGYSSLSYLHLLPVDYLKIDRSFVNNMETADSTIKVVKLIIALAQSLGIKIIAEGVETDTQVGMLGNLGATHLQGYFFSRPVSVREATGIITSNLGMEIKKQVKEKRPDYPLVELALS